MRIVRVTDGTNETYGFVKGNKIAIKSEITELTGVPIPINVKDFLFDGWYEEITARSLTSRSAASAATRCRRHS